MADRNESHVLPPGIEEDGHNQLERASGCFDEEEDGMNEQIETVNDYFVSEAGGRYVIGNPKRGPMTEEEAIRLAAWLVNMAGDLERFKKIYWEIRKAYLTGYYGGER